MSDGVTANPFYGKLSGYQSKPIIEVINNDNRIIIFFSDGLILEIDNLTGEVLFEQNIKVNNISEINFYEKYVLITQDNGKTLFFE